MNTTIIAYLFTLLFVSNPSSDNASLVCLSTPEAMVYKELNKVRKSKGLYRIPLSADLTYVAQAHARDLANNHPDKGACNMHSWSNRGKWSPCCYTPDHKKAACMWNKPKEMTDYTGNGFEIAYRGKNLRRAMVDFLNSTKGHGKVILNRGQWKNMRWKGVGIGVAGDYLVIWFGDAKDNQKANFCR